MLKLKIALAVLFLTELSWGHTSEPEDIYCPLDSTKFTIMVTMSYTTTGGYFDFQKEGFIGDLYESMVNSCPKCHYSGYKKDFDTTFSEPVKQDLLQLLEPYREKKMDDVTENEIAVQVHLYFKDSNDHIADLYLVASYFLRGNEKKKDKRIELQRNCIHYLLMGIASNEFREDELATINYLIGELYRRTGGFEEAIKYFNVAIADPKRKEWVTKYVESQKKLAEDKDARNDI